MVQANAEKRQSEVDKAVLRVCSIPWSLHVKLGFTVVFEGFRVFDGGLWAVGFSRLSALSIALKTFCKVKNKGSIGCRWWGRL